MTQFCPQRTHVPVLVRGHLCWTLAISSFRWVASAPCLPLCSVLWLQYSTGPLGYLLRAASLHPFHMKKLRLRGLTRYSRSHSTWVVGPWLGPGSGWLYHWACVSWLSKHWNTQFLSYSHWDADNCSFQIENLPNMVKFWSHINAHQSKNDSINHGISKPYSAAMKRQTRIVHFK